MLTYSPLFNTSSESIFVSRESNEGLRVKTSTHLRTACCVRPYFVLVLAYCVPFYNKNNLFLPFHLHEEDSYTVCGMHRHT